jgi:hypothetical protein
MVVCGSWGSYYGGFGEVVLHTMAEALVEDGTVETVLLIILVMVDILITLVLIKVE